MIRLLRIREIGLFFSSFFFFCSANLGGNPTGPSNTPFISNLQLFPQTAFVGQGGGAIILSGRVEFVDIDGDITAVLVSSNNLVFSTSLQSITGFQSGVVRFNVTISTATAGTFRVQVSVVDGHGNESNRLISLFSVQ